MVFSPLLLSFFQIVTHTQVDWRTVRARRKSMSSLRSCAVRQCTSTPCFLNRRRQRKVLVCLYEVGNILPLRQTHTRMVLSCSLHALDVSSIAHSIILNCTHSCARPFRVRQFANGHLCSVTDQRKFFVRQYLLETDAEKGLPLSRKANATTIHRGSNRKWQQSEVCCAVFPFPYYILAGNSLPTG